MKATRECWAIAAIGAVFALVAVGATRPVALVGTIVVGGWLIGTAWNGARAFRATDETLTVEYTVETETTQQHTPITATITVTRPAATAVIPLRLTPSFPPGVTPTDDTEATLTLDRGETEATLVLSLTPSVAGSFTLPAPAVRLTDPVELYTETITAGPTPDLTVLPETPTVHIGKGGQAYGNAFGEHETDQPGPGITMRELRQYTAGEDAMNIDWKSTARLGEPYVRETEGETDRHTVLLVDHRERTGRGDPPQTPFSYVREAALGMVGSAIQTNDPVSLWGIGDETVTTTVAAGSDPTTYSRVQNALLSMTPTEADTAVPTRRGTHAARRETLAAETPFDQILRAYTSGDTVFDTVRDDAFVDAVYRARSQVGGDGWFVMFTTDHDPDRLRESVKIAAEGGSEVLVFVVPTALFSDGALAAAVDTYEAYSAFETLRRELDSHPRVTALELAPGDRLQAVLATRQAKSGGRAHS